MRDSLGQSERTKSQNLARARAERKEKKRKEKMVTGILADHHPISGSSKQSARYFLLGFRSLSK